MNKRRKLIIITCLIVATFLLIGGYFISKNFIFTNEQKNQVKENNKNDNSEIKEEDNLSIEETDAKEEVESINDNANENNNSKNEKKEEENNKKTTTIESNVSDKQTSTNEQKETTTKKDVASTYELKSFNNLQYYLYTPSNPTSGMPLIIYLHGGTNKKSNVESLLTTDGFPKYLYDGYYGNLRAYVVIPKLTNNYTGWSDISNTLQSLINDTISTYGINVNKISLTGHSMGGTGTYQVQVKLPNTFACIAPMSGSIKNTEENKSALSKTKIWAFIGTNDTIVDPSSTRTIIEELKTSGYNVRITEFDGATHFDVPSLGYKNSEFINWLVNCSK